MSVGNSRKRKTLALAVLCSLLLVLTCAVFPHALGATNDTSNGIAVITEDEAAKDSAVGDNAAKADGEQSDEGTQEGDRPVEAPSSESTESGDKSESATSEEESKVTEEETPAAPENAANGSEQEDSNDDNGVAPTAVAQITAHQFVTNSWKGSFIIDSSMSAGGQNITDGFGMTVANIAASIAAKNGIEDEGDYTFWKVSLKGKDGNINYGDKQYSVDGNNFRKDSAPKETETGASVSRIKIDEKTGKLQVLFDNSGDGWDTKDFVTIGSTKDLQLVFYYYMDGSITNDSGKSLVDMHLTDWFEDSHKGWGDNDTAGHAKAIRVVVVDDSATDDNGKPKQLGVSAPMYYHNDNVGVSGISATIGAGLDGYDVVSAEKYAATKQTDGDVEFKDYSYKTLIKSYSTSQLLAGEVATNWASNANTTQWRPNDKDPNRIVIVIHVNKTGNVSLTKELAGTGSDEYKDKLFTFTAQFTVPENSKTQLKTAYKIEGAGDNAQQINVVVSADGKTGTASGIKAKPDQTVTIKGLPLGTRVTFSETPGSDWDPSRFTTTTVYTNNGENSATTDAAVADKGQCVVTNKTSDAEGKLTVTKTFTGLNALTITERQRLTDTFKITVKNEEKTINLAVNNIQGNDNETIGTPGDDNAVTYTWTMDHVPTGNVTLSESGYSVEGKGVVTSTSVREGSQEPQDKTEITVSSTKNQKVAFTNQYSSDPIDLTVVKKWNVGNAEHPGKVTVEIQGKLANGTKVVSRDMEVNTNGNEGSATVKDLPSRKTDDPSGAQVIDYTVVETKAGDQAIGDSPYVAGDAVEEPENTFAITNSLKYSLRVFKYTGDEANPQGLAGARFTLTREGENEPVATLASRDDGYTNVYAGLADGTYTLAETYVPAGYQMAEPLKLVMNNGVLTVDGNVLSPDEDGGHQFTVKVMNSKIADLPQTGGVGNTPLFVGGVALIAGAVAFATRKKFVQK